jgi:hypothetical protein
VVPPAAPAGERSPLVFSAPDAGPGPRRVYYQLYSPAAVAGAALLGGLPAGCLLLATNYRRLKQNAAAGLTAVAGLVGTLGICAALWTYADVPPGLAALGYLGPLFLAQFLGSSLLLGALARLLQGRAFATHVRAGGRRASFWGPAAAYLVCGSFVFLLQTGLTYPGDWSFTSARLEVTPNQEIYYGHGITRDQAERLGRKLRELGLFDDRGWSKTVGVAKEGDCIRVRVFLHEDAWRDPNVLDGFQELRDQLARDVFPGSPVDLVLCDQFNQVETVVKKRP